MASELKSYVEKFLLNPAASFNVDDEGNEETSAQIVESLANDEGVEKHQQSRSKLRARNEALALEADARYRGKKVQRKALKEDISFDPELTKYFAADGDSDENEDSEKSSEIENDDDDLQENQTDRDEDEDEEENEYSEEFEEEEEEEEEEAAAYNEEEDASRQNNHQQNDGLIYEGDFSQFAEDFEEEDESDDEDEENDSEEGEAEEEEEEEKHYSDVGVEKDPTESSGKRSTLSIKTFQSLDEEEEIKKSHSVKKQLAVYDSLFEMRISMQKGVAGANQLPQYNTYKSFIHEKDPNYLKNLMSAKSSAKKLLDMLLEIQMNLLSQNPDTKSLLTGTKKGDAGGSDEEITSSEDEGISQKMEVASQNQGKKRKLKLDEYEDIICKRHASLLPFRDETLTRWYEKTKLLSNARGRDKFSGFEVSALQQLNNILINKPQLVRRTQLTGVTRGTAYHVLGTDGGNIAETDKEEYDPEIFDDSDFYSRALEEMLKSKISLSDDMSDVSRKWIEIQKLRKKAKKKVDTKASKGRKLRFEVISKLQQYIAPCNPSQMDDSAINTLFTSLFGKGIQANNNGTL